MKRCPDCGDRNFSVTWRGVEVYNRYTEGVDGNIILQSRDEYNFDPSEKVIECRNCGWEAPIDEEIEFARWLTGEGVL